MNVNVTYLNPFHLCFPGGGQDTLRLSLVEDVENCFYFVPYAVVSLVFTASFGWSFDNCSCCCPFYLSVCLCVRTCVQPAWIFKKYLSSKSLKLRWSGHSGHSILSSRPFSINSQPWGNNLIRRGCNNLANERALSSAPSQPRKRVYAHAVSIE